AVAPSTPVQPPAAPANLARPAGNDAIVIALDKRGDALRLTVPFAAPTAAAVFSRADTLWMVFDTPAVIDAAAVMHELIQDAQVTASQDSSIVRLKLQRPRLISTAV